MDLSGIPNPSGKANVNVRLASATTILRLVPFLDKSKAVEAALASFGFERLPDPGRHTNAGQYRLAWAGRNCWHLISFDANAALERELQEALEGLAAVTNGRDGLQCIEITGSDAIALMTKGCSLDLDHLPPGHCAVTLMAHTRLHIHRLSEAGFQLMIPASHAASFWEWLCMSAAEFGMDVEVPTERKSEPDDDSAGNR